MGPKEYARPRNALAAHVDEEDKTSYLIQVSGSNYKRIWLDDRVYRNPQKSIRDHVDHEDKTVNESFTVNGASPVLVNENAIAMHVDNDDS